MAQNNGWLGKRHSEATLAKMRDARVLRDQGFVTVRPSRKPLLDRTGLVTGRLTVIKYADFRVGKKKTRAWVCACVCGKQCVVSDSNLMNGQQSCGCLRRESLAKIARERHVGMTHCVHGHPYTKENVYTYKRKDGKTSRRCLTCDHARVRREYSKFVAFIRSLKSHCVKCGESHPACLDIHHKDRDLKTFLVNAAGTRSRARIEAELKNAEVLCSNCHRKLHYEEKMAAKNGQAA